MPLKYPVEDKVAINVGSAQQQLKRILSSPAFEATKAQRAFLQFIVEMTLSGKSSEIKGYTVATQVFGRSDNFNQAADPVVSIHANKLRRALERYYFLEGSGDPIRIDLPKGTYVPTISRQVFADKDVDSGHSQLAEGIEGACTSLLIQPFNNLTGYTDKDYLGIGLAAELATEIARFQEIKVLFPTEEPAESDSTVGCRFILRGRIYQADNIITINVNLTDMTTGQQIWGDTYRSSIETKELLALQERVVPIIAVKSAGDYGAIPKTLVAETRHKPPSELNTYEAILRFYEYEYTYSPDSFARAMESLNHAVIAEPDCGQAWSMLANLYADIHSFDYHGVDKPLEKATEYAEKGARINPDNQRTLGTLALIRFFNDELASALKEVERALELNPNSLFVLDGLAYIMTLCGEWERGTQLIKKVMRLNPFYRPTVHYALWADCLRREDIDGAYLETMKLRRPAIFWYPLAKAATLGLMGKTEEANSYLKKLLNIKPDFPVKCRMLIGHYIKFESIIDCVMAGLRHAGLHVIER